MKSNGLTLPFILLCILLIGGTLGYRVIESWAYEDCFTMTVHTITTLGLKEVQPLSRMGLQFTNALVIIGVIVLMYSLGVVGEVLISGHLETILGKKKDIRMLDKISNHYIVCGYGKMGKVVTHELMENGETVVVIEKKDTFNDTLTEEKIPHLIGEATNDELLKNAGIDKAKGIISTVSNSAENLFIVISSRQLNSTIKIVAISDDHSIHPKLRKAGADNIINPFEIGGARLALSLLKPTACAFMETAMRGQLHDQIHIDEIELIKGHKWTNKTIADIPPRNQSRINVMSIKRSNGEMIFFPHSDTALEINDILIVLSDKKTTS